MKDLQLSYCPRLETGGRVTHWIDDVMQYVNIFKGKFFEPWIYLKFQEAVIKSNFGPVTESIVKNYVRDDFEHTNDD